MSRHGASKANSKFAVTIAFLNVGDRSLSANFSSAGHLAGVRWSTHCYVKVLGGVGHSSSFTIKFGASVLIALSHALRQILRAGERLVILGIGTGSSPHRGDNMRNSFLSACGAAAALFSIPATAADVGIGSPSLMAKATMSSWEFAVRVGPGLYVLGNPYGQFSTTSLSYLYGGIAGDATLAYRINSWIAPFVGARGFVSMMNGGDLAKRYIIPNEFDVAATASHLTAFGGKVGVQIGADRFRVSPYGFYDQVSAKTTFVSTDLITLTKTTTTATLNSPAFGAGLQSDLLLFQNVGISSDVFIGTLGRPSSIMGNTGKTYVAGGTLSIVTRF